MATRQVVTIAGAAILGLTLVSSGVRAQDLYAGIQARVPDLALMTMLVGPLEDDASCKDALEKSAAGLRDTCSICTFGYQRCFSGSELHGTYKKILEKNPISYPYIIVQNIRIIYSDGSPNMLLQLCEQNASGYRERLDPAATCVKPAG